MNPPSTAPLNNEAKTKLVGFFLESLDDEHEVGVLEGAIAGAREASVTLLAVAGGALADPDVNRAARNFAFDVLADQLDGIVAFTSALASECGPAVAAQFLNRLHNENIVCAGVALPGYPSVEVDSAIGTRAAVQHLLDEHGARSIAYICGPPSSAEVQQRFGAFEQTLSSNGIELDRRYVLDGDYSRASGALAIATLFDEHRISPSNLDAVMAANDYMALGAMEELTRRGQRIPEDVAVVGFDNVESARLVRPTLSTVAQPAAELGRASVNLLMNRQPGEGRVNLQTEFVVRASCGCAEMSGGLGASMKRSSSTVAGSFVQRRQVIRAELVRASRGHLGAAGRDWEERLLDGLISELRGAQQGQLNRALGQLLRKVPLSVVTGGVVQDLLTSLRAQSLLCVDDRGMREHLEALLHDARAYAASFACASLSDHTRNDLEKQRSLHRKMRTAMFGTNEELSQVAADHLPHFGVPGAVVAALEIPNQIDGPAHLLMGFGPGGRIARRERTTLRALVRHPLIERVGRTLLLLPLVAEGQALGVALLSVQRIEGSFLEDFTDSLAAVIRGTANAQWSTAPARGMSTTPPRSE
jgi:DNA-binding LacI/PurR family transcriptional regulator